MGTPDRTSAERPGSLVDSREGFDPRLVLFHGIIASLLLVLAGGLAYQQLFKSDIHHERERQQNERRIIIPGPRGNIYDRDGRLLVGNRPRFAVVLYLDELRQEFRREFIRIRKNYRETGDNDLPTSAQMEQIARSSVVQRYLDRVDTILGRTETVDGARLQRHFERQLLLPYTLIDDLQPGDFARLIETLPANSPLQIYTSNTRFYPFKSAAAHVLGYVGVNEGGEDEDFPGEGLTTFTMKGTAGRDGIEKNFDARLQGDAGYTIIRVDPAGYKVNPPLEQRSPVQGGSLTTSLDVDLQTAAEDSMSEFTGAAVAIDVESGEVLAMASKPDYDLSLFSPRLSAAAVADIDARGAWLNRAMDATYPPGSTFKIVTTITGLLKGSIDPERSTATCEGSMLVGSHRFSCDNGEGRHGTIALREAIAKSCDVFFWTYGLQTGAETIAAEARRFHLDAPTGIELPGETRRMLIPDAAWKLKARHESWFPGDTANMSIGQGFVSVTPLGMACFAASVARGETLTRPTLLHEPGRARQRTEPIGLSPAQRAALLDGMEGCTTEGTAKVITLVDALRVPGVRIAGKTGTAQVVTAKGKVDVAWFICFAPIEHPRIALAIAIEGDKPGENFAGGLYAAPVASAILRKYFEKTGGAGGL
jgi:penicillin-binding protein 2